MNLFSYIKSRLSILDVVNEYTKLKQAGAYWKASCPFHHEKTASFTVSPHKEIFYCFGCHTGGDLIAFISKVEHCSQWEAAQFLIERYQIEVPAEFTQTKQQDRGEKNRYFNLCEQLAVWCQDMLKKTPTAYRYVLDRGISQASIEHFNLGYFPGGPKAIRALTAFMGTNSILVDDLKEVHILADGNNALYSPFEERIMFPIKDHVGRLCGFGGRIFLPNDVRAKYYNSHENANFNKGSLLFGFDQAKKSIQQQDELFLVEGYTDCIAMVQYGHANTVATLGTACTGEHLKILSRYATKINVMYDGDNAGRQAILRLTTLCWHVNIELNVVPLPATEDPASFLLKGGKLNTLLPQSKDIFSFFIDTMGEGFTEKPLAKKLQAIEKLLTIVNNIPDTIKRDIILHKASQTLDIPLASLKTELDKLGKNTKESAQGEQTPIPTEPEALEQDSCIPLEKRIVRAILNNTSLLNEENEDYLIACLPEPLNAVLQKVRDLREQHPTTSPDFSQLFERLDENEQHYVSKMLMECDSLEKADDFEHLLEHFQRRTWKTVVRVMRARLEKAEREQNTQEIENILNSFSKLKQKLLSKNLIVGNNG
jgi:DNA primase